MSGTYKWPLGTESGPWLGASEAMVTLLSYCKKVNSANNTRKLGNISFPYHDSK